MPCSTLPLKGGAAIKEQKCSLCFLITFAKTAERRWDSMENENYINAEICLNADKNSREPIWNILATPLFSILVCMICLCGTSWAWFQTSRSNNVPPIQTADYALKLQWNEETETQTIDGNGCKFQLMANTSYQIKLQAEGTARTGFCRIVFEDIVYYTDQIALGEEISFTVNTTKDSVIEIASQWGTCAEQASENKIPNGGKIGADISKQEETPEPETETTADSEQPEQNSKQETPQNTLENTETEEQKPEQPEETTDQKQITEQENQEKEKTEEPETEVGAVPETEFSQDSEPITQELENSEKAVETPEEDLQPEETNPS